MDSKFEHYDLRLIVPKFEEEITDLIIGLESLRTKIPIGTTPPDLFFQCKHIYHVLESIGSARIEGNRTTILEYFETKIDDIKDGDEEINEIANMEKALIFIDKNIENTQINRILLSELHKIVVESLIKEGSLTPGNYRKNMVKIAGSSHALPDGSMIPTYMDELFGFINETHPSKYDLLKIALVHHRFVWIHPFDNGNGRTARLLTYAMLVKHGFNVQVGQRIINPVSIFCKDRDMYYEKLSVADDGSVEGLIKWSYYMLEGLKRGIEKVDQLLDYNFLKSIILIPAVGFALERKFITIVEAKILKLVIDKVEIMNFDIQKIFPNRNPADISRLIKNLITKKMLMPKGEKQRKYLLRFDNNLLLRGVINSLGENGFLPLDE